MSGMLRLSVSLDGKLLGASGRPLRRGIPLSMISEARELELTIHPVITGNDTAPSLSGLPGPFLPDDLRWELLSLAAGSQGRVTVRYRRKGLKAERASRRSPAAG